MLTRFRRRFIGLNFGLIALVLSLTFTAVGVIMHREYMDNLQATMWSLLQPLQYTYGQIDTEDLSRYDIVGGIYHKPDGSVSFFDQEASIEGVDLEEAVRQASAQEGDFGRLKDFGVFYYAEDAEYDMKIAVMDQKPVRQSMRHFALELAGIYGASLALFFVLIVFLSRLAVRPVQEAWEQERRFMTDASHELKTPLTVIRANMGVLRKFPSVMDTEAAHWVESTEETAKNMDDLIESMLSYSAASESQSEPEMIDFSSLTERQFLQMEALAYDKDVDLSLDGEKGLSVWADAAGANLVVQNLLGNAIKYEPVGGSVEVTLTGEKTEVVLTIRNRQASIDEAELPHLFDRFYQPAGNSAQGHGLGLAIARRAMERLGGRIRVYRPEGGGTCFEAVFKRKT